MMKALSRIGFRRLWLPFSLIFALVGTEAPAETLKAADANELERLVSEASRQGAQIIIIEAPSGTADVLAASEQPTFKAVFQERALEARTRFREILAGAADFPTQAAATIRSHDAEGSMMWPIRVVLWAALFLVVGYGAERLFHFWARPHFRYIFNPTPESRAEKICYLLIRGTMRLVGVAVQIGAASLLALTFDQGRPHIRDTWIIVIGAVAALRVLAVFFQNLLASDTPSHRLLNLSDAAAGSLQHGLLGLLAIIAVSASLCLWMEALDLNLDAHLLTLLAATLLATVLIIGLVIWQRRAVAGMILGFGAPEGKPLPLRLLSRMWHVPAIIYFALAWNVTAVRLVLELPNALGLITRPILIVFLAIAAYGVALLLIEWAFARRAGGAGIGAPGTTDPGEAAGSVSGQQPKTFKDLAQHAAAFVVAAAAAWWILNLWGLKFVQRDGVLQNLWEIFLVAFLAYLAFQSVKIAVDSRIAEEGGFEEAEPGEEGSAQAGSRLATLLPLFRNFLLIVIAVIGGMIALSELGVDIAPLFAGAGVVGLAVGFGAQTLIRDIFSGAFFLMDDAFRRGEYINVGSVKGIVEKISIRSLQLRHHMGPLQTIPFGEIQHLTNYSRDWVMMKLKMRVTYDTDIEKVRKLVKDLGKELLKHPEIGAKFLQPLKSQGVYQMEDSAMIIRVKFMTRPGDQFVVRKLVYAKVRELFEKEGIKFAHREVTVHVTETPQGRPLSQQEKEAVAGAVLPLIEADSPAPTGTDNR